jgi:hypothetical protein
MWEKQGRGERFCCLKTTTACGISGFGRLLTVGWLIQSRHHWQPLAIMGGSHLLAKGWQWQPLAGVAGGRALAPSLSRPWRAGEKKTDAGELFKGKKG